MAQLLAMVFEMRTPVDPWLREGFIRWFRARHTLPLERCLNLPTTAAKQQQAVRDYWLLKAIDQIAAPTAWQGGQLLEKELSDFITRGHWRRWKGLVDPPSHAGALDRALFYAVKFNKGAGLCARQLTRIMGHKFPK